MSLLLPTAYLPPVSYMSLLLRDPGARLERHEHFVKKSIRNRCAITGANGPLLLSVPVDHDDRWRKPIGAIAIASNQHWKNSHRKSIESAYRHAPYFEFYADSLFETLFEEHTTLFALNKRLLELMLKWLKQPQETNDTESFTPYVESENDRRRSWDDREATVPAARTYRQVFSDRHGFLSDLSIIDLVFNTGPDAIGYL